MQQMLLEKGRRRHRHLFIPCTETSSLLDLLFSIFDRTKCQKLTESCYKLIVLDKKGPTIKKIWDTILVCV